LPQYWIVAAALACDPFRLPDRVCVEFVIGYRADEMAMAHWFIYTPIYFNPNYPIGSWTSASVPLIRKHTMNLILIIVRSVVKTSSHLSRMYVSNLLTFAAIVMLATVMFLTATLPSTAAAQTSIVPEGAKVEKLFTGIELTEGVAVAPDGLVYFSDITFSNQTKQDDGSFHAGHIWVFDPKTEKTKIFRSPSGMSNGIKFDASGNMVVCEGADYGGRRVTRTDMKTGQSFVIAGMFDNRDFNAPNDVTLDEKGRIYFSDPRYLGHEPLEQPVMSVYRIDTDLSIHRIIADAGKPNGVCVSPDQKTLYVVCHDNGSTGVIPPIEGNAKPQPKKGHMQLMAYDLHDNGTATFRKTLVDYYPQDGPDGLCCDVKGNLYVAERDVTKPGIGVYSAAGKQLEFIPTELPTNVGFGRGTDANLLYITAGSSLFRIRLTNAGYHLPAKLRK
jgi:gluconolactonase